MKKICIVLLSIAMALCANAQMSELIYTYANDDLEAWGKGKAETIDVAMRIDRPALSGKKITAVTALINTVEDISDVSIWLTNDLNLENKVNIPDIISVEITPYYGTYNDIEGVGILTVTFDEPYELSDTPVYVGYSLNVESATNDQTRNPLLLSNAYNDDGLYLHMSKSVLKWKNYSSMLNAVAPIYVTLTGDFPEYAVGLNEIKDTYAPVGESYYSTAIINNIGLIDVQSLEYTYEVNGNKKKGVVEFEVPLKTDLVNSQTVDLLFDPIDELGDFMVDVTIDKVNGMPNTFNKSCTFATFVKSFVPVRRPLIEEYTGTWCSWCARGWLALELIKEWYPETVCAVAYHYNDPMQVTKKFPTNVENFPNATLNRGDLIDPYYGTYESSDFGIQYDIDNETALFAPVDLSLEAYYNEERSKVEVKSFTRFVESTDNVSYKIGYVLVADGLSGTDSQWAQKNAYAGYTSYKGTYLEEMCNLSNPISDIKFNDVAIDVNATMGIEDSLPATVESTQIYEHCYTYDISDNSLVQEQAVLKVVAFVIDTATNRIINSNKIMVADKSGVGEIDDETVQAISTIYYDLMGRRVEEPLQGLFIKVQKMSDGTQVSHKVMKRY